MAGKSHPLRRSARPHVAKPRTTKAKHTRTTRKQLAAKVAKQAASIGTAEDRLTEAVRAGVVHALREPGSS